MIVHPRASDDAALAGLVERARARARRLGRRQLVVHRRELEGSLDVVETFAAGRARWGEAVYLTQPGDEREWCALGVVQRTVADGEHPAAQLAGALRALRADVDGAAPGAPLALGGFAFAAGGAPGPEWADFPAGELLVPRLLATGGAGPASLAVAIAVGPTDDVAELVDAAQADLERGLDPGRPRSASGGVRVRARQSEPADWAAQVALTAADVRAGRCSKLVLARRERVAFSGELDPADALQRLRADHPQASVFAFARAERLFLGASPERLVRLSHGRFAVDALAGTGPRGTTSGEDERFSADLLASAKNRREHAIVVEAVRDAIADVCRELDVPREPAVRAIKDVAHLWTPLAGRVLPGRSVLDLVARLHPTPAVAGWPRAGAAERIRRREGFDRGWYAGAVGWVDVAGDGDFAVAIRSALLGPGAALLYAGCGIMGDSDPAAEAAEAELKFRTMTAALGLA